MKRSASSREVKIPLDPAAGSGVWNGPRATSPPARSRWDVLGRTVVQRTSAECRRIWNGPFLRVPLPRFSRGQTGLRQGTELVCAGQASSGAALAWATGVVQVITPVGVWLGWAMAAWNLSFQAGRSCPVKLRGRSSPRMSSRRSRSRRSRRERQGSPSAVRPVPRSPVPRWDR
jgi:hypothetical protein